VNYLIKLEELTLVLPPLACPVVVVVTTACLLLDINYEHLVIAIYVDDCDFVRCTGFESKSAHAGHFLPNGGKPRNR